MIAVKQATPDLDQAAEIVRHGGLALYAGNDDLLMPFLRLGGVGGIHVASHVAGRRMREMISLVAAGDVEPPSESTRAFARSMRGSRSPPTRSR